MRPTPEQLAPLTPFERATFRLADVLAQPALTPLSANWNTVVMGALIYSCSSRRFHVHGLENFAKLGKKDSVLLVANHRSFFDFFTITALLYWRTKLTKRIFFPVRQKFFYDHPLGPAVNFAMSGMRMFPPIMRAAEKKLFNGYSIARCIQELNRSDIGTVVGLHPEGTRNKGDDPYAFLPAQPGVGRVALGATRAHVIPVFVLGMANSIKGEVKKNIFAPDDHPVDVYFGAPIGFDDLRGKAKMITTQKRASDRCLDAIKVLADRQRAAAAVREGRDPASVAIVEKSDDRARTVAATAKTSVLKAEQASAQDGG